MKNFTSNAHTNGRQSFDLRWLFLVVLTLFVNVVAFGQSVFSATGTGSAWLTAGNWTPSGVPSTTGYAQFQLNPLTTGTVGINMNGSTNNGANNQAVGGIEVTGSRAVPLVIGNSTTVAAGVFTLTGTTINAISNTVIRNSTSQLFTIQQNVGTGTSAMTLALANTTDNIISIDGTGGVIISVPITGTNRLTKGGSGAGVLQLTGANTYTGLTTVNAGTLQLNRSGGTTIPATNSIVVNGGTLIISQNQTLANLTLASGATLNIAAGVTLTITGTFNHNGGTINLNGTGVIAYGAGATLSYGGSATQTLNAAEWPTTNGPTNIIVNNAAGFRFNASRTVAGNVTITSGNVQNSSGTGATLTMTGAAATLSVAGSITGTNVGAGNDINLTYTNTSGTLTISGAGSLCRFLNVTNTNSGSTLLLTRSLEVMFGTFTQNGILQLNSGGSISSAVNAVAPTYGNASTLVYNTTYNVSNEWTGNATTAGLGVPQNVTIQNSAAVNMPNGSNLNRGLAGNLTITSGSLTLGNNATNNDLYIGGNWNRSSGTTFNPNNRAVFFVGSGTQTITTVGGETFDFLIVNKPSGTVQLASNVAISNNRVVTLTNGTITLGNFDFTLGTGTTLSNTSATRYFITNGTGQLRQIVGSTAVLFPVGNTAYNPINLTNTGTSDTYGIRVVDGAVENANDATFAINRAWVVSEGTAGGGNLTANIQYNTGEAAANFSTGSISYMGLYTNALWTQVAATITGSNPFTATNSVSFTSSLGGTSYFAVGRDNAFLQGCAAGTVTVSIAASPSGAICAGTNVTFTATPTNGGANPSYQWKVNGNNLGTNSATFSSSSLTNGDVVTCEVTNAALCTPIGTSNSITMTVNAVPTTAAAGSNQIICTGGVAIMAANTPTVGTGTWTVTSGPSTLTSQFSSTTSPTATFTPAGGAGTYVLTWTISNGSCSPSSSNVTITVSATGATIGTQPANVTSCIGATSQLTVNGVNATGFVWRRTNNGWGTAGAWNLISGNGGFFRGSSANNGGGGTGTIDTSGNAWGMFNNGATVTEAIRDFAPLAVGQVFQIDMDNGFVNGTVGFTLRNASNANMVEFYFRGGQSFYEINRSGGAVFTDLGYTPNGVRFTLTVTTATTYSITIQGLNGGGTFGPYTGTFINTGSISRLRAFSANNATGSNFDLFFNNIQTGANSAGALLFNDNAAAYTGWSNGDNRGTSPLANGATGNGSTISGATTNTLSIASSVAQDAATYEVTVFNNCGGVTSNGATLTLNTPPTANAGTAITTCSDSGAVSIVAGATATNAASTLWTSSGTGTFSNASSITACTYTPSVADIAAGSVTLTLTANGNAGCAAVTSTKTLTIVAAPTANAGSAIATCSDSGAVSIVTGATATNTSGITWTTSGTGTFSNATSITSCTYTPSLADITAGSVTITLTAAPNSGCFNPAVATKIITITAAPNAGTINGTLAICSNGTSTLTSNGAVGGTWTSSNTAAATVNPTSGVVSGVAAGTTTITYTVTGTGGCANATATATVTVTAAPNAGSLSGTQSICGTGTTTFTSNGNAGGTWSSSNTGVATVNPTSGVITGVAAGTATITYTVTGAGACADATATRTVTVFEVPTTSVAGTSQSICFGSTATLDANTPLVGTGAWTVSGPSTLASQFSNTTNPTATFTPAGGAGTYTLTWTISNGTCTPSTSTVTITVNAAVNYGTVATTTANTNTNLVISQVYGGGGNSGATLNRDFVEIFNPTTSPISINGYSIQYASSSGTTWSNTGALSGTINPGGYYLVQMTLTGANGSALPTPDFTVASAIDMAAANGKVALVNNTSTLSGSCPSGVVDFVGYGTANCFEGTAATGAISVTTAARRNSNGCTDTNQNGTDFSVLAPLPRNSATAANICAGSPTSVQTICSGATPNSMSVSGVSGSSSFTYQWYSFNGQTTAPTGSVIPGTWTSLGTVNGADTTTYTPGALTATTTFACYVTPTGTPGCGTGTWASSQRQVVVNALPTPTFTVAPTATTCASTDVTYTTQSGQSGYVWTVQGVLNTDYSIISGGIGTSSNTVTLRWLTAGSKIVTVNYSNSNGCTASSAASSTTTVIALPTVVTVSGGGTICGSSTTITATNGGSGTIYFQGTTSGGTSTATPSTSQVVSTSGTYYFRAQSAEGCWGPEGSVIVTLVTPPTATGATICAGGSGSMSVPTLVGAGTSLTGTWIASPTAAIPPAAISNVATCSFGTTVRNYTAQQFQVSITGSYTFEMNDNSSYDGMGYITTGSFTPGSCTTGTWVRGDDDGGVNDEPLMTATLTAGVTYTLYSTTYSATTGTYVGTFGWTITPPSGGQILIPNSVNWYNVASGGSVLGTSTTFNPVGVVGSGLTDTNTAGTYTYYVANQATPTCRTAVNFVINPRPTATISSSISPVCSGSTASFTLTGTTGAVVTYTLNGGATTQITLNGGTATIDVVGATVDQTLALVSVTNPITSCSQVLSQTATVVVSPTTVAGTLSSNQTVCTGTGATLTLNGQTGSVVKWQRADDLAFTVNVTDISNTTATLNTGSLSQTSYYRAVVKSGACLEVTTNVVTITVTPNTTITAQPQSQTVCQGDSVTFSVTAANSPSGYLYQWYKNGVSISGENNATLTIAAVALTDAATYTVEVLGECGPVLTSDNAVLTVNSPTSPTFNAVNPICIGDSLSALPTTSNNGIVGTWTPALDNTQTTTYTFTPNAGQCATTASLTITVNSLVTPTFSPVAPICQGAPLAALPTTSTNGITGTWSPALDNTQTTTYTFTPDAGQCASTATLTITVGGTTTWNGTAWSNGAPDALTTAVIAGNYTATANLDACSLVVNNNAVVVIPAGFNVHLSGALTVASGSTFTLNSNANLLQDDASAVNSGNIIVRRTTNPLIRLDYVMWSSPVAAQNLQAFSPLTSVSPTIRFYTYNTTTNLFANVADFATHPMVLGRGYLIRLPFNHPTAPATWTGIFTGVPNNGTQNITMANVAPGQRYNLVGNPYPSTLSMTDFYNDNSNAIEPTVYFWRKTNGTQNPTYCTYNLSTDTYTDNGQPFTEDPNGVIQVGQGFIVEAKDAATTLTFNNGQRVANNANQTFRTAASTQSIERHRVWLNLTGTAGEFSQMMVGYFTDGTLGLDGTDSKYFNDGTTELTSPVNGVACVMNGRPVPFDAADVVPLTYKVATAGTFSVAVDRKDGLFTSTTQPIYVHDLTTGTYHNLNDGPYTFTTAVGTFANRLELVYQNALSTENPTLNANTFTVVKNPTQVQVAATESIDTVRVYDLRGRLIVQQSKVNATQVSLPVVGNQVYLVQVTTTSGLTGVKKVL